MGNSSGSVMKIRKMGAGQKIRSRVQKTPQTRTMPMALWYPFRIRCRFPAPWFWAIKEFTAAENPSAVIQEMDSI